MNILAIGDVIGKPGRQALTQLLPSVKRAYGIDFTIVNAKISPVASASRLKQPPNCWKPVLMC